MRRSVLLAVVVVILLLWVPALVWGAADLSRSDMRLVGHLRFSDLPNDSLGGIAIADNHAFVVTYGFPDGLHSVDVSNPRNPVLLDFLEWKGHCVRLIVRDQLAYIGSWAAGLMIVDVSNPRQMQEVGGIAFGKYLLNLKVVDDFAYVLTEAVVGNERFEIAVDISNPTRPTIAPDAPIPAGIWENKLPPQISIIGSNLRLLNDDNREIAYYEARGAYEAIGPSEQELLYLISNEGLHILEHAPSGQYSQILRLQEMSVGQEYSGRIVLSESADNPDAGYFLLDVGNEVVKAVFWDRVEFLLPTGAKDFIPDISQIEVWHRLKEQGVEIKEFGLKNNIPYVFQPYPLPPVRLDVNTSFIDEILDKEVEIPLKVADLKPDDEVAIAAGDGWAVVQLTMPPGYFQEPAEEKPSIEQRQRALNSGSKLTIWARIKTLAR